MNTREIMQVALDMAGLTEIPYDSGILVEGTDIKKVLFGVDMETPEILLAKQLGYDLVLGHHPTDGNPTIQFSKVMLRQIEVMTRFGIPINKAQKALRRRMVSVDMGHHVGNHDRSASAARLIGMPFMNIHVPADIITENYLQSIMDETFPEGHWSTLGDVMKKLNELDAYKDKIGGPVIRVGGENDYAGKIAVLMAGGTNGGADVFKAYFEAGVGTIVCMHVPEDVKKAVEEQNIGNIIVAGHMASDSIGLNMIADELEKRGLEVTRMGGIL